VGLASPLGLHAAEQVEPRGLGARLALRVPPVRDATQVQALLPALDARPAPGAKPAKVEWLQDEPRGPDAPQQQGEMRRSCAQPEPHGQHRA
jgi:hypothetical protein